VRIAFVHHPGRLARLEAARSGTAPTEFLFGAVELERAGHDVVHFELDPNASTSRLLRRAIDGSAGRGHLPPHLAAATLRGGWALRRELGRVDVVVASTTGTAMALATWRAARMLRTPLVGIVAGLVNDPWSRRRAVTTRALLWRMHSVLYGEGELEPLLSRAPFLHERIHVNPFGVDTGFWKPGDEDCDGVLAIGNDGHRDWDTLVAAASKITAPVEIYTARSRPDTLPANVAWRPAGWHEQVLSDRDVRDLYRRAAVVVVPVQDVPQPSGQSVTLQAMACGRPVVLTRTRGLWSSSGPVDGVNVTFVSPRDPDALAGGVVDLLGRRDRRAELGRAAREFVEEHASVAAYADRLLAICELALVRP